MLVPEHGAARSSPAPLRSRSAGGILGVDESLVPAGCCQGAVTDMVRRSAGQSTRRPPSLRMTLTASPRDPRPAGSQHRSGAAGQRSAETGIANVARVDAAGTADIPLPGTRPGRHDRVTTWPGSGGCPIGPLLARADTVPSVISAATTVPSDLRLRMAGGRCILLRRANRGAQYAGLGTLRRRALVVLPMARAGTWALRGPGALRGDSPLWDGPGGRWLGPDPDSRGWFGHSVLHWKNGDRRAYR